MSNNPTQQQKLSLNEQIKGISTIKDSGWIKDATWRQENRYWLKTSQKIALIVLEYLRVNNITQKEFATIMNVSPSYISKLVKGKENLTINTICSLEKALNIKILNI